MKENNINKIYEVVIKLDFEIRRLTLENKRLENEIKRLYRRQNYGIEYTTKKIERVKKGL